MKKMYFLVIAWAVFFTACPLTPIIDPPDPLLSINLARCADCKNILTRPYVQRHDGKVEGGIFWEVPIKKVGDSIMPINNSENNTWSSQILVVDNFEQLNSLRISIGWSGNISRPIVHNYTPEFFDTSALIFLTVSTPSMGDVPHLFFYALVTDAQYFYPVFGLAGHGMDAAIGRRSFLIEVDRAIVDNYNIGSLGMGPGWRANWNKFNGNINYLCNECKGGWAFTPPSDEWGIRVGQDDSILVKQDLNFSIINNRLQWSSGLGGSYRVYIKRPGMDDFEYLFDAIGNGHNYLVKLNLLEGINAIRIVGNNMAYRDGVFIRVYDYFEIEKASGYVERNYQFDVSIRSGSGEMELSWNSTGGYSVYVQRAGYENFERVSAFTSGTVRRLSMGIFGFLPGTNRIKIVTYTFEGGKAVRNIAWYSLVLEVEKRQINYNFRLVGGGLPEPKWRGGYAITWSGTNQFYERYIRRARDSDFVSLGSGPSSWAILLNGFNFSDDTHTLRVEGWEFSGGALRRIYSDFNFEVRTQEHPNINFLIRDGRLFWDYSHPWRIHSVAIKRAGTDYFDLVTDLAIGGFDSWSPVQLSWLGLKAGKNIIKITVAWSQSGNILTRTVGYFTINH